MNSYDALQDLVARLCGPGGCPWDQEQTHQSLRQYVIEEAYEVVDAIDAGDMDELCEELGDLAFQAFFHAHIAQQAGAFDMDDVLRRLHRKMVDRHPHVFGGGAELETAGEVLSQWVDIKQREKAHRTSLLDGIPRHLPALATAWKYQKRAARIGFDWPEAGQVLDKVEEEIGELRQAIADGDQSHREEEVGDLLFALVNLARKLDVEPEVALNRANAKFRRRFALVESRAADAGSQPDLAQLDRWWDEAKAAERAPEEKQ